MVIYFYQNKFLHMYFSKIKQTFCDLLFTRETLNDCIRKFLFFPIDLISLIHGNPVLLDYNKPHC